MDGSLSEIDVPIPADASVQHLCNLLVQCERMQHRYQWTSGVILLTLMNNPEAPKRKSAFADWIAKQTGMHLSQNEIDRRISVYRFYSKFDDARIIELIQSGGVNIAYRAAKLLAPNEPERVRAVLEACVADPIHANETLDRLANVERKTRKRLSKVQLAEVRKRITDAASDGKVPLTLVLELLENMVSE